MPIKPVEADSFQFIAELPEREEQERESPDFFGETIPAAFRMENIVGSRLADQRVRERVSIRRENNERVFELDFDPNFNPLSEDYLSGYEPFAERFGRVLTKREGDALKAQIDRENKDRETIANAGVGGFVAAIGAGILDPTIFVPLGGTATKGRSLYEVSRSMLFAGFVGTSVQEGLLYSDQETRTEEEVAVNVAAGTILAGALGTGGVALYRKLTGKPVNADVQSSVNSDAAQSQRDSVIPEDEEIDWLDETQTLTIDRLLTRLDDETNEAIRVEVNKARKEAGIEELPEFRVKDDFIELAKTEGVEPDSSPVLPKGVFADLVETERPGVDRALVSRERRADEAAASRDTNLSRIDALESQIPQDLRSMTVPELRSKFQEIFEMPIVGNVRKNDLIDRFSREISARRLEVRKAYDSATADTGIGVGALPRRPERKNPYLGRKSFRVGDRAERIAEIEPEVRTSDPDDVKFAKLRNASSSTVDPNSFEYKAFDNLPEYGLSANEAKAVEMARNNYPNNIIADELELTEGSVAVMLTRARQKLEAFDVEVPKGYHKANTKTERLIQLVGLGLTNPQIAERLNTTTNFVKKQKSMLKKQGLIPPKGKFALMAPDEQFQLDFDGAAPMSDALARQRLNDIRRAAHKAFGGDYRTLEQTGRISFARQASDLDPEFAIHDSTAQAFTTESGNVTIFTRTTEPKDVPGIILHEAGIHAGMREMIGPKGMDDLLKRIDNLLEEGDLAASRARENVPDDTKPEHVREETLAYLVQYAPRNAVVKELISKVKAWIAKTFPGLIKRLGLNEADFRQLALMALRNEAIIEGEVRAKIGPIWDIHEAGRAAPKKKPMFNLASPLVLADRISPDMGARIQKLRETAAHVPTLVRENREAFLSSAFMERLFQNIEDFDPFAWRELIERIDQGGDLLDVKAFDDIINALPEVKPLEIPRVHAQQTDARFAKRRSSSAPAQSRPELDSLPSFRELAGTVNAQARRRASSRELEFRGVNGLMKFLGRFDPTARVQTSGIKSAQQLNESLVEMSLALNKNAPDIQLKTHADGTKERVAYWQPTDQSVESSIKRRTQELHGRTRRVLAEEYSSYLGNRNGFSGRLQSSAQSAIAGAQKLTGNTPGKMTMADFGTSVTQALRRGEKSMDPDVERAAKRIRDEVMQPFEDEMVELGLFGFDLEVDAAGNTIATPRKPNLEGTADGYVPRFYDINKIKDNRAEFTKLVFEHFKKKREQAGFEARAQESELAQMRVERDNLNKEIRETLKKRRGLLRNASELRQKAETDVKTAKATTREANAQNKLSEDRVEKLEIDPASEAYYKALYKEVMRGEADDEPMDLLKFIRENGGITGIGEIMELDRAFPLNIMGRAGHKKKPMHWDYMREAAAEAGYIRMESDGAEFGDLLAEAASGRKVYSEADQDWVAHNSMIQELAEKMALDERGGTFSDFVRAMEGKGFIDDKTLSGRASEARLRHRQTAKRLAKGEDILDDAGDNLQIARIMASAMREVSPQLTEALTDMRKSVNRVRREMNWKQREMERNSFKADAPDEFLLDDARETVDNILMTPGGRMQREGRANSYGTEQRVDAHLLSSRFKSRKLDWSDVDIEDWLIDDFDYVMGAFVRSVVPDVEFVKKFGSLDLDAQIQRVRREVAEKVEKKQITQDRGDEIIKLLISQRDRLRGVYGLPADPDSFWESAASVATTANTLRLMGGVTISSIPDVPRAVFANGLRNSLGPALRGMFDGFKGSRLAAQELEDAGVGFEIVLNSRLTEMTDVISRHGRNTQLDRALQSGQSAFGHASLMTQWNGLWKQVAGQSVQNRILKMASKSKISRTDAQFAARLGLSLDDVRAMGKAFKDHGSSVNGQRFANSRAWRPSLREKWLNAVRQEVDRVIVTPGSDKPLKASTTLGRVLLQFQSYNFAATQRVIGSYMQGMITEPEARILVAFVSQIGLGMMVAGLKAQSYGIDVNEWSTEKWIVEGVDRSGVLGVMSSVNLALEAVPGNPITLSRLAGDEPISRRAVVNRTGAFLGPSFGLAQDALTAAGILTTGRADEAQAGAARRILPLQNIFYLRELFDLLEQSVDENLEDPEE